ncbi:hypothetical protein BSZ21_17480 [Bradyrhizobium canariense]|nr:hypothetical protein BSZ21_17480 [Bradyrhizobium canariense]
METPEELLVRLATVLDGLESDAGLLVPARYMERGFGGTGAIAISKAEVFARAHGCEFEYSRTARQGRFSRKYPPGGRA